MAESGYPQTHPGYTQGPLITGRLLCPPSFTNFEPCDVSSICQSTTVRSPEHRLLSLQWQWSWEKTTSLANAIDLLPRQRPRSQMIKIDPFQSSQRLRVLPKLSQLRPAPQEVSTPRYMRTTPIETSIALTKGLQKKARATTETLVVIKPYPFIPSILQRNGLHKANPLVSASVSLSRSPRVQGLDCQHQSKGRQQTYHRTITRTQVMSAFKTATKVIASQPWRSMIALHEETRGPVWGTLDKPYQRTCQVRLRILMETTATQVSRHFRVGHQLSDALLAAVS